MTTTRTETAQLLASILAEYGDEMDATSPTHGDGSIANALVQVIEWLDVDVYNLAVGGA